MNYENKEEEIQTVSLWVRLGIYIMDNFSFMAILNILLAVFAYFKVQIPNPFIFNKNHDLIGLQWEGILIIKGLQYLYYFIMEVTLSQTFGKILTRTKVVNRFDETPTWTEIALRTFCRFIPFDELSFMSNGIGWHDRISQTYVRNL